VTADHLLHDLDEAQRRAVTSPARPLAILAPAGSGKTRVLTRRIAWRVETGDADASHVLALTFTRKAAGELRDRLRALGLRDGVAAGTFHGVAYAQLRGRWADEGRPAPELLVRKGRLLDEIVGRSRGQSQLSVGQLAAEIEWAKSRLTGPDGYADAVAAARRRTPSPPRRIANLYRRYEEAKRKARMVDFDDLLRLCSHLIETDADFAAAQRWRQRHLFVDEFQDVNPLQLRLLDAWRGDSYDLCVVGDPQQAI
jgi:DNA helicase II / ATP-dependent DNA helicase PcrA